MQLAPAKVIQPPLWGPNPIGTYIGTAYGMPDCAESDTPPFLVHLKMGERIGSPDGWASQKDAETAVEQLTDGYAPGGVVFKAEDGRFYATELVGREDYDREWGPVDLEDGYSGVPDWYLTTSKHAEKAGVVAIIDGEYGGVSI